MKTIMILLNVMAIMVCNGRPASPRIIKWTGSTIHKNPSYVCPYCGRTYPAIPKSLGIKERRMLWNEIMKTQKLHIHLNHKNSVTR